MAGSSNAKQANLKPYIGPSAPMPQILDAGNVRILPFPDLSAENLTIFLNRIQAGEIVPAFLNVDSNTMALYTDLWF